MKATFHKIACNQPISILPRSLQGLVRGLLASNAIPVTKWDPSAAVGWESHFMRTFSFPSPWILNCGIGSFRLGWSKMGMFWDCESFPGPSASQPRTMMTILSTWAVCHLPLVKSYHLSFRRALTSCYA